MELGFSWPRQEGNGSCIPAVGLRDPGSALPETSWGHPSSPSRGRQRVLGALPNTPRKNAQMRGLDPWLSSAQHPGD